MIPQPKFEVGDQVTYEMAGVGLEVEEGKYGTSIRIRLEIGEEFWIDAENLHR